MINLVEVTPENWRVNIGVAPEQKTHVCDKAGILARAYAYRNSRSNALLICDDDTPVGIALYYDLDDLKEYDLCQFFIDARYQRKGYGTEAAKQILKLLKDDGKFDKVTLCYTEGNTAAKNFYEKLGFTYTGDCEDGEIVMERKL